VGTPVALGGDLAGAQASRLTLLAVAVAGASDAGGGAAVPSLRLVPVVTGLNAPVYVTAPRSQPGRLYVVEQAGRIRVVVGGKLQRRLFLDIHSRVRSGDLLGLFSLAFHPGYPRDPRFYVDYTGRNGSVYVVEFRVRRGRGLPDSARVVLRLQTAPDRFSHDGGQLAFGPDGRLYVGVGDGLDAPAAQDPASPLGKVLRIDVDTPFAPPETVLTGLRNPWRFSFDLRTGDLFVGDVGAEHWEEVDYLRHGAIDGRDLGWPLYEGREPVGAVPSSPPPGLTFPLVVYPHPPEGCSAVVGGYVYRGRALPAYRGRYLYGDLCRGVVWSLRVRGGVAADRRRERIVVPKLLVSFGKDARGELYAVSLDGDTVYRLASA
jgi:glucose/arabinose dehydrogenase